MLWRKLGKEILGEQYWYLRSAPNPEPMRDGPVLSPPKFQLIGLDYIPEGAISLIRFIRSDRKLDIFGEDFEVPKELVYTYVRAKIITGLHQIQLYSGDELASTFQYQLPPWLSPNP
jgi:hypothetical protein